LYKLPIYRVKWPVPHEVYTCNIFLPWTCILSVYVWYGELLLARSTMNIITLMYVMYRLCTDCYYWMSTLYMEDIVFNAIIIQQVHAIFFLYIWHGSTVPLVVLSPCSAGARIFWILSRVHMHLEPLRNLINSWLVWKSVNVIKIWWIWYSLLHHNTLNWIKLPKKLGLKPPDLLYVALRLLRSEIAAGVKLQEVSFLLKLHKCACTCWKQIHVN